MPIYPDRRHTVAGQLLEQLPPKVGVEHRFPVGLAESAPLPVFQPSQTKRIDQILAVAVKRDLAGLLQGPQPLNGSHQLHAVVGGQPVSPRQLQPVRPVAQHNPISPFSGVPTACAVGIELHLLHQR